MNQYKWDGVSVSGVKLSGITTAKTRKLARHQLRQQRVIVRKLTKVWRSLHTRNTSKVKKILITLFTQHLATLINAGINLSQACDILKQGQDNHQIKQSIQSIQQDLDAGCMLSESLSKQPQFFNSLFCSLVKTGEHSGMLVIMLNKVDQHYQKIAYIKKKLYQATAYPTAVLLLGLVITALLLTVVIPQFETLFLSFGAKLPMITHCVIRASELINDYWSIVLLSVAGFLFGLYYAYKQSTDVTKFVHSYLIRLPIIGKIVQNACIERFARTLSITFAAGLPLTEALTLVADVTGNILFAQAIQDIRQDVSRGESIQQAVIRTQLFPHLVCLMIGIGEESGSLDHMLKNIADIYEEKVNRAIDTASHFLEPGIMAILGLFVGVLVVAMYLPIITLGSVV